MHSSVILKELISKLNTSVRAFEIAIGVGPTAIDKAIKAESKIKEDTILKILKKYPIVSEHWLRTGEGEMFFDQAKSVRDFVDRQTIAPEHDSPYHANKPTGDDLRKRKAIGTPEDDTDPGLIYVPISAQAGYTRSFTDTIYLNQLERLYIPGLPYKGDKYRYFDVEGDSMYPTIEDGMQVIGHRIEPEDWKHASNYYAHVIVTQSQVMIKRIYHMNDDTLVLISDNEEMYPQITMPWKDVRELWHVKRILDWRIPPPKQIQIKVK